MSSYIVILSATPRSLYLGRFRDGWATTYDREKAARFTQYDCALDMLKKWAASNGRVVADRSPQTDFLAFISSEQNNNKTN